MIKKKILFIQPSPYDKHKKPIKKSRLYFVGLAMPLLAALTPKTWGVEICLETIEPINFKTDAELIAIGTMGHGVLRSIDIAKKFMSLGKTVILGGYMASIMREEAKKYCDVVAIGDSEGYWSQLIEDYEKNTLKPYYEEKIHVLNTPLPRFDLIIQKKIGNFLPVQAGRGCPKACSFCSVACLYESRYIKRPLQDVKRDILQVKSLGYKKFLLLDDHIASDREYLIELCKLIEPLKMKWMSQCAIEIADDKELLDEMKKSGCVTLSFGLESIESESLTNMDKAWAKPNEYPRQIQNIRNAGIDVSTEMVVGGEGDTLESLKLTAKFIEDMKITVPRFYILTPIPGTRFFEKIKEDGRLIEDNIYSFDGTRAVYLPKNMTAKELTDAYWELYNEVFSIKSILKRTIFRKEIFKEPFKYIFYTIVNFYYRNNIKKGITPNIF